MFIFYQFFSHCFYLIFFPVCHTCIIKLEIQILNLCTLVYIEKQNTNAGVFCILTRFYFEPGNDFWGTKSSCFLQKEGSFAICTRSIVGPVLVLALQLGEKVCCHIFQCWRLYLVRQALICLTVLFHHAFTGGLNLVHVCTAVLCWYSEANGTSSTGCRVSSAHIMPSNCG